MTENRLKMSHVETHFEFFNYTALSDDEVQKIKNLLKEPCSAVKLPKFTFFVEDADVKPTGEFKQASPSPLPVTPEVTPPSTLSSATTSPSNSPSRSQHQLQHHVSQVEYSQLSMVPVSVAACGHYTTQHMSPSPIYPVPTSVTGAAYLQTGYTLGHSLYMTATPKTMDAGGSYRILNGANGVPSDAVMEATGGMMLSPGMYASPAPCYSMYAPCPPHQQYVFNPAHAFLTPIAPMHQSPSMRHGAPSSGNEQHHLHHHQQQQQTSVPSPYMIAVPPVQAPPPPILQPMPMASIMTAAPPPPMRMVDTTIGASVTPIMQPLQSYEVVVDMGMNEMEEAEVNLDATDEDRSPPPYEMDEDELVGQEEPMDERAFQPQPPEVEADQTVDDGYVDEEDQPYADSGVAEEGDEMAGADMEGDEGFLEAVVPDEGAEELEVEASLNAEEEGEENEELVGQAEPAAVQPVTPTAELVTAKSWASLFKSSAVVYSAPVNFPPPFPRSTPPAASQVESPSSRQQPQVSSATNGVPSHTAKSPVVQLEDRRSAANVSKGAATYKNLPSRTSSSAPSQPSNGADHSDSNDLHQLGDVLQHFQHDFRNVNFLPRGLSNKGNWCYIGSTLQSLLACPPFYNLLLKLPSISGLKHGKSVTPITDTMVEFIHEFAPVSLQRMFQAAPATSRRKEELSFGSPFEPVYIYTMLSKLKLNAFEGRQEDAEEFLGCLLNGLHDEMCAALHSVGTKGSPVNGNVEIEAALDHPAEAALDEENTDDSWQVMEKRNKASVTRVTDFNTSPVSEIFCGKIRSALHYGSFSSATLQPFFTLQLDIQSDTVRSVEDAMQGLVVKESLQGYMCSKTKQEVTACRQMTLEELPPVLILHLKRFIYDKDGGSMKLSKRVEFSIELKLNKELLSPTVKARIKGRQRIYRLIAVVYHCGGETGKGHYVADVFHQGSSTWLRADDARLACISENKVLHHPPTNIPYLLFYRRSDTIIPSPSSHAGGGGGGNGGTTPNNK